MTWEEFLAGLTEQEQKIVYNLGEICEAIKPVRILEIGSGWGMSTRAFLHYAPAAFVVTVDKIPADSRKGYNERVAGQKKRLQEMYGDSKKLVPQIEGSFDIVYIDGSHVYEEVLADLRNALPKVQHGGTIIMDDVLHAKHKDGEYGVLPALREVLHENLGKNWRISLALVGHGQAIINI